MKNILLFILMSVILTGTSLADNNSLPKGKHKSHKKTKKKKSGYYYNFQH